MTTVVNTDQAVTTPTVRRFFRTIRFWIAIVVIVIVVTIFSALTNGASLNASPLAADGTGTVGSKALVEVLRQQGVTVTATDTLRRTKVAATTAEDTTILLYDAGGYLSDAKLREVRGLAKHLIVVHPSFRQLRVLAPSVKLAGRAKNTLTTDCDVPAVVKAGTVTAGGFGYRVTNPTDTETTCLGSGDGIYSLIQLSSAVGDVTVLGTVNALTNQHIIEKGNAALALNLLGSSHKLVWYLPSIDDEVGPAGPPSIADASPAWLVPLAGLVFVVVIVAGIWRGRRFGPLVVERLPVTVRASETMEGRARLYEKSSARRRALDALRMGSIERLAGTCGLGKLAPVDEVIGVVAGVVSRPLPDIRWLLLDAVPHTDRDLIRLSDELLILERAVETATRPA